MGPPVLFSHGEAFCKLEFWNGMTPLSVAAFFGDQALVRCLLQAGSDVTVSNSCGDLPEDLATAQHHHQVTELLGSFSMTGRDGCSAAAPLYRPIHFSLKCRKKVGLNISSVYPCISVPQHASYECFLE